MDEVFERVLVDHSGRSSVFTMGKLGILWEIDRKTGRDIVAFLLSANMLPAGEKDLDVDAAALQQIHITAKPPSGR